MHLAVVFFFATAAVSPHGAVATAHPLASEAGASMLRHGGNAIVSISAGFHALTISRRLCGFDLIWSITLSI